MEMFFFFFFFFCNRTNVRVSIVRIYIDGDFLNGSLNGNHMPLLAGEDF